MINTLKIYHELSETMGEQSAKKLAEAIGAMYEDLLNTVTKKDFDGLKDIVKELVDVQKRTEIKVEELTEAQRETQRDVGRLDRAMQELAEAQKRTEVRVGELAEAQKRTEVKVEELADAQRETQKDVGRLDRVMQELAEAQKRTEIEIEKLSKGLDEPRGKVGGLSKSMSYAFENEAYRCLPAVLKEKYGIEVKERIIRAEIGGGEINIFCKAEREGHEALVIGEAKLRLDERRERRMYLKS